MYNSVVKYAEFFDTTGLSLSLLALLPLLALLTLLIFLTLSTHVKQFPNSGATMQKKNTKGKRKKRS